MSRRRVVIAAAIVLAIVALSWPLNLFDVRAKAPFASVASAFDPPPAYPGYRWTRNGRETGQFELTTIAGPSHCSAWRSATMLFLAWPVSAVAKSGDQSRQYVRDPRGALGASYRERLALHATLPADAVSTGFRLGQIELFLAPPGQDDAVYLVAPSGAERWPRADPMVLCM